MYKKATPHSESTTPTSVFAPKPKTSSAQPPVSYTTKVPSASYFKRESTTPTNVFKK